MKLYATVTSERANKGQGGNEYVGIYLKDESRETIVEIYAIPDDTNNSVRVWIKGQGNSKWFSIPKGEKQKGKLRCELCGTDETPDEVGNCPNCGHYLLVE